MKTRIENWTYTAAEEPGFYWFKQRPECEVVVVHIFRATHGDMERPCPGWAAGTLLGKHLHNSPDPIEAGQARGYFRCIQGSSVPIPIPNVPAKNSHEAKPTPKGKATRKKASARKSGEQTGEGVKPVGATSGEGPGQTGELPLEPS